MPPRFEAHEIEDVVVKHFVACAVLLGYSTAMPAAAYADVSYFDPVCPSASAPVQSYLALVRVETTRIVDAVAAANVAAAAYDRCGERYRSAGDAEHVHYASVDAAQYRFAAGHLLRLDGQFEAARTSLSAAIAGVGDTIVWGRASAPSDYKAAAVTVRDAAQAELAKLAAPSPAASDLLAPSPQPTRS